MIRSNLHDKMLSICKAVKMNKKKKKTIGQRIIVWWDEYCSHVPMVHKIFLRRTARSPARRGHNQLYRSRTRVVTFTSHGAPPAKSSKPVWNVRTATYRIVLSSQPIGRMTFYISVVRIGSINRRILIARFDLLIT